MRMWPAGMVFWLPKGMLLRTILEDFLRREHIKRGYQLVQGPQVLRRELWEQSGHYANYRENMYFTEIEGDMYGIKPMNCVSHMLIYNAHLRSYRELPQRYFELGVVHRHEKSGVLHGLLRVRQFTQDDAHIICAPEQLEDEIIGVIALVRDLMALFGFQYRVVISTKPAKAIGSDEAWELATNALIKAVDSANLSYTINAGDGALLRPEDRREGDGRHRPRMAALHHPVRLYVAGTLRAGIRGTGWRAASPRYGAPRHSGVAGTFYRGAYRALRRSFPHLARSRAGQDIDCYRRTERLC